MKKKWKLEVEINEDNTVTINSERENLSVLELIGLIDILAMKARAGCFNADKAEKDVSEIEVD